MNKTIKRVAMALTVVLAIAGLAVAASPASASAGSCPSSTFCTWNGKNWSGSPAWSQNVGGVGSCYNISAINGANNNAESLYNRESFAVSVYSGSNGSGYLFTIAAGAGEGDLSIHPILNGDNIASSICHD